MNNSPGYDFMDWQEDSSLHIIQPASSPWRKRSYDTYNDTNDPYYPNDAYSDTLRNYTEVVAPFVDANGQPAHYVTDVHGNTVLQTIVPPQPPQPIGYYLPEFLKWIVCGVALAVFGSLEVASRIYKNYARVSVQVGNSAKRRLVEFTEEAFAPAPPRRRHRRDVPQHRRPSSIIRRISPRSPGGRTHIPVTPPRARPRATLKEAIIGNHDCIVDYVPSNIKHVRSGAFVTSAEDDYMMSGITYHPYFEPLMSGALQDIEMEEDVPSSIPTPVSPYHIPGTFPNSPALPGLPSTESATSEPPALPGLPSTESATSQSPALPGLPSTESATSESPASADLMITQEVDTNELATSDEQAFDDVGTPHSEASEEPYTPNMQPAPAFPLQQVDSRPRNYKGELLDDWQIKICKEFQAIHPPPRDIQQQATSVPKQLHAPNSTGLIEPHLSPLANESPLTPHQQHMTTTTGSIDSRRSPMAGVSNTGAADATMELHGSTAGFLHQPHGLTSIGLNDLHRSPLDLHKATTEMIHCPNVQSSSGSSDLHRSPLDLHRATTEDLRQPNGATSIGSNDLYRSPLADVQPTMAGVMVKDLHNTTSDIAYDPPGTAIIGSIDSLRSPSADLSPINSLHGTDSIGSIDSPRSPLADLSLIHRQLGLSPSMPTYPPGSPWTYSSMEPAGHAMANTRGAGPDVSDLAGGATPVPLMTPSTSPSSTITLTPVISPSKWSIRSLYARVQGKPKKRSPLCERINSGNIHKVPKTPKRVTWPENGPVTGTKRFVKNEAMSHPSPTSSREESSILSSVPSDFSPQPCPTMQEEEEDAALTGVHPPVFARDDRSIRQISSGESNIIDPVSIIEHTDASQNVGEEQTLNSSSSSDNEASVESVETPTKSAAADPSTPASSLSPKLEELTISTRRSSLRRREKEDQAQKLRDAIAAEEKARKDQEEAEEKARRDKEEAVERARIEAEEEEERKKTGGRRIPVEKAIQSLPPGWDEKVRINMAKGMREQLAMTSVGNPLTRRDFGMILPQPGTGDDPSGWLNDEVISGYLQAVVDHGHRAMGHPRGTKPRMHAFNPFFYTTLKDRGYDAVKRWSSRAKIGGTDLKSVEYVFIPCNPSRNHWTLVVVSPVRKTIEVFDSMHGSSSDKVNTTKSWLRGELGRSYVDSEWTVIEDPAYPGRGKGPVQNNANDCGVFTVTTAKMVVLGVDPMAVSAEDMPLQRRRLVAELLNGGFSGEFEPHIVFE